MKEKIPRRSSHCSVGGEPFSPGSEYLSVLMETERADYCPACFEKGSRAGLYWRGRVPLKREKRQTPDEKALELFRRVEDPQLLVVLALYLQRRDQIVKRSDNYYEIPETGEVIAVPKIHLSPQEGRVAGEQVVKLLDAS